MFPNLVLGYSSGYDADASLYFAQHSVQLSSAKKTVVNQLVKDLKAYGLYSTKFDAMYLFCMTTEQQSLINLIVPGTNTLTKNGTPTFTANVGFSTMGNNTHHLIMPNAMNTLTKFTQNNGCFGGWGISIGAENAVFCGEASANNYVAPNYQGLHMYGRITNGTNSSISSGGGGDGLKIINRTTSSAIQGYANGSLTFNQTGFTSVSTGLTNAFRFLNCGASVPQTTCTMVIGLIGASCDATEQANLYTALSAFRTAWALT